MENSLLFCSMHYCNILIITKKGGKMEVIKAKEVIA